MHSIGVWWLWTIFFIIVITILGIDIALGALKSHKVSFREALIWAGVCVLSAIGFGILIWLYASHVTTREIAVQKTLEFYTGFVIEQSLSVDNLFVFIMIFNYFRVPNLYQRRILMYGIWGAIIMRFIMILIGTWLVETIHWILYVFGAFLVYTSIKILKESEEEDLSDNPLVVFAKKHFRMTKDFHAEQFFVRINNLLYVTPLFLVLLLIEGSDLIFALDSIPAIFAITRDPFIVFTSNIFAILGLRALYFILADMADKFHLMKYGISAVLAIIGIKMLVEPWFKLPTIVSLILVVTILSLSIVLSFYIKPHHKKE